MNDKVKMVGKCFNFRLVAGLDTVLNGKGMKMKNLQQELPGLFNLLWCLAKQVDPNNRIVFGKQCREVYSRKSLLHLFRAVSVNKYFHREYAGDYTEKVG